MYRKESLTVLPCYGLCLSRNWSFLDSWIVLQCRPVMYDAESSAILEALGVCKSGLRRTSCLYIPGISTALATIHHPKSQWYDFDSKGLIY